jgi:predicted RNA-binding protein associated with RNAse of E/G family
MFKPLSVTVTVNIPALADLVAYLRSEQTTQAEIDAAAAEVGAVASRLQQSNQGLQAATKSTET